MADGLNPSVVAIVMDLRCSRCHERLRFSLTDEWRGDVEPCRACARAAEARGVRIGRMTGDDSAADIDVRIITPGGTLPTAEKRTFRLGE